MAPTAVKPVAWMIEAPRNPQASGSGAAHESARKTSAPDASVIFTLDTRGQQPKAFWGGYAVSKAALGALLAILVDEWESRPNLRVNGVVPGGNWNDAKNYVAVFYSHVPVLDAGARGSTTTFVQRGIGDILVSWENEAHLAIQEAGPGKFEIVYPSVSMLAEPPVALLDGNVDRHGTRKVAEAYLQFLYSKKGQEIEAKNFYRPRDVQTLTAHKADFPSLKLYTVDYAFGGWHKAQTTHFGDGGVFDQIYKPQAK